MSAVRPFVNSALFSSKARTKGTGNSFSYSFFVRISFVFRRRFVILSPFHRRESTSLLFSFHTPPRGSTPSKQIERDVATTLDTISSRSRVFVLRFTRQTHGCQYARTALQRDRKRNSWRNIAPFSRTLHAKSRRIIGQVNPSSSRSETGRFFAMWIRYTRFETEPFFEQTFEQRSFRKGGG